ncbi:efflux RND transporter permease subunit [Flavihumibacter sp. ZG627]|uniref:efflux RND transporter permease subunit n=1 Tax=Flavihumibacter sp. ZG627 TaxID=1463156 RepID=UPI00057F9392|nr:efflux RND transporter permease subunit [Flavihumibacter sp. ZG627]KIC90287.1 acriflavin resistance protein [Flavihumibacter sp. ZG627]
MNIIRLALRKPVAIIVVVLAIGYFSFLVVRKINVDIFPKIESPAIYIAMPYGGLTPSYMDGFMANEFQKVLVFVSGVKDIEFKSIQGFTLMKLSFYADADMAQAAADVSTQVSRAMGFLPPGSVPPQVVRFDGSSLPIGQLVFESDKRSIGEIQNLVLTRIRPMFVTIPGITAPAPFGGNIRSIVIKVNPDLMQSLGLSVEEVMTAVAKNNLPSPAGNIRMGDKNYMSPVNSMAKGPEEFLNLPVRVNENGMVFIKDIATVEDAADITTGYAVVNGKRSVYLPVIKKADASTLKVVENLKASMQQLKASLPDDVKIDYIFDQSVYIKRSISNLVHEGILGAILTGLMVLLFLGDKRGALIVVLTIPISILSAVLLLYAFGQTINIMTLSGLALAIGILVDEATVTIENIHQHFEKGKTKSRSILDALLEISIPKLLILLCILSVLIPSFIMTGIPKDMFLPLSLAVGFSMIASFIFSQTFVPVLANWLMKIKLHTHHVDGNDRPRLTRFEKFKKRYLLLTRRLQQRRKWVVGVYAAIVIGLTSIGFLLIGTDIMPSSGAGDLQVRIVAPSGSRIEKTENYLHQVTDIIAKEAGDYGVSITSAFVGTQPSGTAINPIFLFTSSSQEAVLQVSVNKKALSTSVDHLKENIRKRVKEQLPELQISFEPIELMEKIISQGTNTPVQIRVSAPQLPAAEAYAKRIEAALKKHLFFRDIRVEEPVNYPTVQIDVDRDRAAQFGLTMQDVTQALTVATSSTRFINKSLWRDPKSGLVFQVQVQVPEASMQVLDDLKMLTLKSGQVRPILDDVARLSFGTEPAQVNRQGANRYVTVAANLHNKDLGAAAKAVQQAMIEAGEKPKGIITSIPGQLQLLSDTLDGLQKGLAIAIVVIFLMLAAYYQSFAVSGLVLTVVPAVIAGSLWMLLAFGSTLNLQSYMGIIMSVGVSVSNAFLMVDHAEKSRFRNKLDAGISAYLAASSRLRPIIMTALAMIAGMVPMAAGFGEGGEQVAPLGQAVIGGLLMSTLTTLLVLPHLFVAFRKNASLLSVSLDPDDLNSRFAGEQFSTYSKPSKINI